jgi:hypothetical protein
MLGGKRRKEFDHTSEGGAWAAESVSDGKDWKPAKEHASNRDKSVKDQTPPRRRVLGL